MAETYEETLEDWYYNHQDDLNLMEYFCRDRYLKDAKWDDSKKESYMGRWLFILKFRH